MKGVSTVSKVASGAGAIGLVTTGAVAAYEYKTGMANTHTMVDVGVAVGGVIVTGIGVVVASPAIIVGAAIGGAVWGIVSFCGGSDYIDQNSNDWGKKVIYGR